MNELDSDFYNEVIDVDGLPDYSEAELQPLAGTFGRYILITQAVYWLPFILGALVASWLPFISSSRDYLLVAPIIILALLIYLYRLADARHRGWALREHDLIARSGVWWRSVTTLPVARIQHVETSSGPIERMHRLARLSCYTAGGMTADLVVIGLNADTADQLREHLLEQIRQRDAYGRDEDALPISEQALEEETESESLDFLNQLEDQQDESNFKQDEPDGAPQRRD